MPIDTLSPQHDLSAAQGYNVKGKARSSPELFCYLSTNTMN